MVNGDVLGVGYSCSGSGSTGELGGLNPVASLVLGFLWLDLCAENGECALVDFVVDRGCKCGGENVDPCLPGFLN